LFFGSSSCSAVGRFTIRELALDGNGNTQRFAVDFEMHCGTMSAPALRGTLEWASTVDVASMAIDRSALRFAIVRSPTGVTAVGTAQAVHATQAGAGQLPWSATSNVPWLTVSPAAAAGSGTIMVSVDPAKAPLALGTSQGTVSIKGADGSVLAGPMSLR
jgi:hypothetical protein